jgi:hypothetical protein
MLEGLARRVLSILRGTALPPYLEDWTWQQRIAHTLDQASDWDNGAFAQANAQYVSALALAKGEDARLHIVFNIGADALRSYLDTDDYKNTYEHPVVEGKRLAPSERRKHVDRVVGLDRPENFYFCAVSIGGTGMRFYGEYCVVLKSPQDEIGVKRILDRNSYDFTCPPLARFLDGQPLARQQEIASKLMCGFRSQDFGDMLSIKVLQHEGSRARLYTAGAVGQAVLFDEDYAEAYHAGKIWLASVLEVRSHPEDEMTESSIQSRHAAGETVSIEEQQWAARRRLAREAMERRDIRHRSVTGNGRGRRWR